MRWRTPQSMPNGLVENATLAVTRACVGVAAARTSQCQPLKPRVRSSVSCATFTLLHRIRSWCKPLLLRSRDVTVCEWCRHSMSVSVRTEGPTRARQAREAFRCHTDMGCRISWNCSRRMRRSLVTCRTSDPPESVADGRSLILHCGRGSRDLRFLGDPGLSAPAKAVWGPGTEPVACWRGGVWARCSMRETRGPTAVT